MVTATRVVNGVDVEFQDYAASINERARCELCKRSYMDFNIADDSIDFRCYDTPHSGPFGDVYERDDWHKIEPWDCDACDEYEQRGLAFPISVNNVLVEQPSIGGFAGYEIGQLVIVRPCDPSFGDKTYLGILVGEMPVQIGLQYVREDGELRVYNVMTNPLIVIPEASAAVYGYESWWKSVDSPDDLKDITDEQIMSQPYMAALASMVADRAAE